MSNILRLLTIKLCVAEEPTLVQSIIGVLATLIRIDADAFLQTIIGLGGNPPALQLIMDKWIERHIEIRTPYDIKRSIVALASILTSPNQMLDQIIVKGCRTDTSSSIRTRSKALTIKEEWSMVPLRCKIALLLLDSYIEAATQGAASLPDEEEWIDEDEDDYEDENEDDTYIDKDDNLGFSSYSMYGELLEEDDAFDVQLADVDILERQRRENDPLMHLSVLNYIPPVLKGFQSSPESFNQFCQLCTPIQAQYLQQVLQS